MNVKQPEEENKELSEKQQSQEADFKQLEEENKELAMKELRWEMKVKQQEKEVSKKRTELEDETTTGGGREEGTGRRRRRRDASCFSRSASRTDKQKRKNCKKKNRKSE